MFISSIDVMYSWAPDSSQKKEPEPKTSNSLDELGVKIDTDNLTLDQVSRPKQYLVIGRIYFLPVPIDGFLQLYMSWPGNI